MKSIANSGVRVLMTLAFLLTSPLLSPLVTNAQTLMQTIDLRQANSSSDLTSLAIDPGINTLYVADGASTNVYLIDTTTNAVTGSVYTAAFGTGALTPTPPQFGVDGLPLGPGYLPNVVLANPITHSWVWLGQSEGVKFTGTTFDELISGKAMRFGAAWDPVTDNIYTVDGLSFFLAINNAKFLLVTFQCGNTIAVNPMTGRVYNGSCVYNGPALTGFRDPAPAPLPRMNLTEVVSGFAVNPNTNRLYAAEIFAATPQLAVIDASDYHVLATIPGLSGPAPVPPNGFATIDYEDLRVVSIAINTVTNTIFVANRLDSSVSIFDGNTNTLTGKITTPDGAVAVAVNEQTNTLYVANAAGTVSVYALDAPVAPPAFSVNGVIKDASGLAQAGINVTATGAAGSASAVTDDTGLFVLTGLQSGSYTVLPASPAFSFAPQTVSVNGANVGGLNFTAKPPIVPVSYTLSPWTMIGAGVSTTGTVTLNQPAPAGGAVVALSSDSKAAKVPATITVPAGQSGASFTVQGSGVSATTLVTLTAAYNNGTAVATLTVAPGDSLKVMSATYSKSQALLQVKATGTNAVATILVQDGKTNAILGTMVNLGNGNYSYQQTISNSAPTSVNIISNLGGKSGQGVSVIN